MKNISVSIDDELYKTAKAEAAKRRKTVSALVHDLLAGLKADAPTISAKKIRAMEIQHVKGYEKFPVAPDEFDVAEEDLVWGD